MFNQILKISLENVLTSTGGKILIAALVILCFLVIVKISKAPKDNNAKTMNAFDVLWRRGWASLDGRKPDEAVRLWKQAYAPGMDGARRARILY